MPRPSLLVLFAASAVASGLGCRERTAASQRPPVRIAAAADLTSAFEEVGRQWERETGERVQFTFGSTGRLARQIKEGAPFDAFAAANASFVDEVVAAHGCDGATKAAYARGRVVAWSRGDRAPTLSDLADPRYAHIAIANPEHAPYGMAAKEALSAAGVWEAVQGRLVYGENVRQALQFAETGNADAALVALSLVSATPEGSWTLVDETLHEPIDQTIVACRGGARFEAGKAFVGFVLSESARATMRRYGFLLPGEAPPAP